MFRRIIIASLLAAMALGGVFWLVPAKDRAGSKVINTVEHFRALKPKAEKGSAQAQFELANLYRTGQGVAQNVQTALHWYRRAADQAYIRAQYELGQIYDKGEGVRPDPLSAIRWYQLAFRQGRLTDAAFALGMMYYRGRGVLKDVSEGIAWFRRAAQRGHPCAQFLMGGVYQEGFAVELNKVESYKWYTVAIPGQAKCLKMDRKYDAIAARARLVKGMSDFEVKKGKERAAGWRVAQ